MILLSLKAENLFSLGKVDIDLSNRGLMLVTGFSEDEQGFNGSGKSSIANKAIIWTLYGETVGGLKADAVLNRHSGKKSGYGEIMFVGTTQQTYLVRRERPAKLSLLAITDVGGSIDISRSTAKETQALIDQLLGFDFETFIQASFFGQGRNLHYPSLPPKEQKAVLEQILPMEDADRWANYADEQITKLKGELVPADLNLRGIGHRIATLEQQQARTGQDGTAFEKNRADDITRAENAVEFVKNDMKQKFAQLEAQRVNIQHVDVPKWESRVQDLRDALDHNMQERDKANAKYIEAADSETRWSHKWHDVRTQAAILQKNSKCPTCERDYEVADRDNLNLKLAEMKIEMDSCDQTIKQCKEAAKYYAKQRDVAQEFCTETVVCIDALIREVNEFKSYELNKREFDAEFRARVAADQGRLAEAQARVNPFVEIHKRLEGEIAELKREELEASRTKDRLTEEMEHLVYWKQVFGKDLKLKLFEDACPFLDARTRYHLDRLKNPQIHVEFSTIKRLASGDIKEEFTVNCWSETGGAGFDSLSGGEQQMTSFAIGLALADLASRVAGAESGFLILDEPFTYMDPRNAEAVVEYLTGEVERGRDTVLLISNDEYLKGLVQKRLHVVKKGGVTHVQE